MELENHTMNHSGLFNLQPDKLAEQVYKQQLALSYILGVEYQPHFLRPRGGDARRCQRMQMYAKQLGYYGIAHWSADGSGDDKKLAKGLKPGAIYLFHTTDTDLEKLLRFIPWVAEQGYQLVTLNEMFDYPANETSPLTIPMEEHQVPPLEPYEMVYVPLKKTTFCWEAYLVQEKLIAMGYLTGEPDGVYGNAARRPSPSTSRTTAWRPTAWPTRTWCARCWRARYERGGAVHGRQPRPVRGGLGGRLPRRSRPGHPADAPAGHGGLRGL